MERKEKILRKALKLYGVNDEEQDSFVEDMKKLEDEEPEEEEQPAVEETPVEEVVEEDKNEEVVEETVEEQPTETEESEHEEEEESVEEEVKVDYDSQISDLKTTIEALQGQVNKLYEMFSKQGKDVDEFGNVGVEPNKTEDYQGDQYLRDRLNGKR